MTVVGVGLLLVGGLTIWRAVRSGGPYRDGPWPGLAPAGAVVLLACALLLAGGQLVAGDLRSPFPDLPVHAVLAVGPLALATRLVGAPGAASAVCGAYLLPRALLSLADQSIEPPPLLLVPAVAFDVSVWLRTTGYRRRRRAVGPGGPGRWRAAAAGAVFGAVLTLVEPSFAVLLGGDAALWSSAELWLAGGVAVLACAIAALAVSGRGTAA